MQDRGEFNTEKLVDQLDAVDQAEVVANALSEFQSAMIGTRDVCTDQLEYLQRKYWTQDDEKVVDQRVKAACAACLAMLQSPKSQITAAENEISASLNELASMKLADDETIAAFHQELTRVVDAHDFLLQGPNSYTDIVRTFTALAENPILKDPENRDAYQDVANVLIKVSGSVTELHKSWSTFEGSEAAALDKVAQKIRAKMDATPKI